ncbi:hypothetical protein H8L32_07410 [Undibacterium sp. CY18W]|uniref:Uncharacterized protein n=1 Tax=Undibacterium hunanense TaxID=2762292 RepID=A0ABR6ZN47_9BURK|nr:hypothetical protein [Undibacterium hunanense]
MARADGSPPQKLTAKPGDWQALREELHGLLTTKAALVVVVADCWVRYFLMELPDEIVSLDDSFLLLNARFENLYGQPAAEWTIQADWHKGEPMLACALPRNLLQALEAYALRSLQPQLVVMWRQQCASLPPTGAWCFVRDGVSTLLYWQEGVLRLVRQLRCADVDALLSLELLRLGAPLPTERFWSGDARPLHWLPREVAA